MNFDSTSSSSSSSSSDDEDCINFVANLTRPRKIARHQVRREHFHYWDDNEFYQRFRLSKETTVGLLELIQDKIKHLTNWNRALQPMEMLLLTLRFYSSGCFLVIAGDFSGVTKCTAGRIIFRVSRAIANLRPKLIKFPDTNEELLNIQKSFYSVARFPRVLGAIDCTHIKIRSPGGAQAEIFKNRKKFFSVNVQTVAGPDLKILDIVARWPGSTDDATIFTNSRIYRRFENLEFGNGILLGGAGYTTSSFLMTPLSETHTKGQNLYNEAQIMTRNTVERSHEVWKRRFPILSNGISLKLEKVQWIIVATAVLHNICIEKNEKEPPKLTDEEQEAFDLTRNVNVGHFNHENSNFAVRNEIINCFNNL